MFPLTLKQQKSTARTSAYQPMIQELQKKWANDKQRQQQEMQKFYEENNIKMTAGCAPMIINMLVLFGIIAVIQAPLNYILQVPADQITNGVAIVQQVSPALEIEKDSYTQQSRLIGEIKDNPQQFIDGVEVTTEEGTSWVTMDAAEVDKVLKFDFQFLGLDLSEAPTLDFNRNLIMPILSVLTMFASQFIIMRFSGSAQQGQGKSMWVMTIVMGVMFGFFAFRVPLGFSLYYTVSNVVQTIQQIIVKQIHDPAKIREEIEREMEEKRLAKKSRKKVSVRETDGSLVSVDLSEAELARLRLQRARDVDAERYGLNQEMSEAEKDAAEKAREMDEARYGRQDDKHAKALPAQKDKEHTGVTEPETLEDDITAGTEADETEEKVAYKPGRRKRARQNREKTGDASFVEQEMQAEEKTVASEEDMEGENA